MFIAQVHLAGQCLLEEQTTTTIIIIIICP
jgi:hypothetical protein